MKNIFLTSLAAAAAISFVAGVSVADTVADNEPAYHGTKVNRSAKANFAAKPTSKAFKTYHSRAGINAFDRRFKVRGQGASDRR